VQNVLWTEAGQTLESWSFWLVFCSRGSAWDPVILPVFKTGGRHYGATVCSTRTRFRHFLCWI
jgi:hypothetical protein